MKENRLIVALKGFIIGATMLVPGCSGGSMAMILGIYHKLITSVSNIFKQFKESIIFLGIFIIGAGIGMVLVAKPLLGLIETFHLPMMYFFMGAVAGSAPLIFKEAKVHSFNIKIPVYIIIGILMILSINLLPEGLFNGSDGGFMSIIALIIAGILAAIALILPGISVSFFLLMLGLYEPVMEAIATLNVVYLIPLAIGLIIGVLATTKILEYCMDQHPYITYLIILGFVIGSMIQVFPGLPSDIFEWIICIVMALAGFGIIYWMSLKESELSK